MPLHSMHVYIPGKPTLTGQKGQKGQKNLKGHELAPISDGRDLDVAT